jgi:hypothetical protein
MPRVTPDISKKMNSGLNGANIYDQVIPRNKWPLLGGPKLQKGAQVPMFSIPGVWAILPSAKGFVKFSPYFLSKEQLCDCWVSYHLWQ